MSSRVNKFFSTSDKLFSNLSIRDHIFLITQAIVEIVMVKAATNNSFIFSIHLTLLSGLRPILFSSGGKSSNETRSMVSSLIKSLDNS